MAEAHRWQHLLTLDSCNPIGLSIWDSGYLHFLAHEADLACLDFARSYAAVQSS